MNSIQRIIHLIGMIILLILVIFFVTPQKTQAFNSTGVCPSGSISGDLIVGHTQTLTGQSTGAPSCPNPVTLTIQAIASDGTSCGVTGGVLSTIGNWSFTTIQSSVSWTPTYLAPPTYQTPDGGTCYLLTDGGQFRDYYILYPDSAATPIPTTQSTPTIQPLPGAFHLDGTCVSTTQINLSWGTSSNKEYYGVYLRVPPGTGPVSLLANTTNTSYSVTGLTPGTSYEFGVAAINYTGTTWNDNGNFLIITCTEIPQTPPPTLACVTATPVVSNTPPSLWQLEINGVNSNNNYGISGANGAQINPAHVCLYGRRGSSDITTFRVVFGNPGPTLINTGPFPDNAQYKVTDRGPVNPTSLPTNFQGYCWDVEFKPGFGNHTMSTQGEVSNSIGSSGLQNLTPQNEFTGPASSQGNPICPAVTIININD